LVEKLKCPYCEEEIDRLVRDVVVKRVDYLVREGDELKIASVSSNRKWSVVNGSWCCPSCNSEIGSTDLALKFMKGEYKGDEEGMGNVDIKNLVEEVNEFGWEKVLKDIIHDLQNSDHILYEDTYLWENVFKINQLRGIEDEKKLYLYDAFLSLVMEIKRIPRIEDVDTKEVAAEIENYSTALNGRKFAVVVEEEEIMKVFRWMIEHLKEYLEVDE